MGMHFLAGVNGMVWSNMNVIAPVPAWLVNVTLHRCALGLEIILLLMRQIDEWFVFFLEIQPAATL